MDALHAWLNYLIENRLVAENSSYAWVVRWSVNERTLFSVR